MTARAIGVFALVLAVASPALAGPQNSVIGGKKLEQDMVHSGGVGYPSIMYEWWNKGKDNLDWGLAGELVYGDWPAAGTGRGIKIGLGIDGMVRWHLATRPHDKLTTDIAILAKPGILIAGDGNNFNFGIAGEALVPVSLDVHERVNVVVGGAFIIRGYLSSGGNEGEIPLLFRLGVEIMANENVEPWFFFDLGPGIAFGETHNGADVGFAWRIGAGTAFWGVMGKNKNKSDSAATASAEEPAEEPAE
jgi:hypothetical protein